MGLIVTIVIDTFIVKVYDLVDKSFIPDRVKFLLFTINASICIISQFILINFLQRSFKRHLIIKTLNVNLLFRILLVSLVVIGTLMGVLILQQFYYNYYKISLPMFIVIISYGTASSFIIRLSILFLSWFKSNHNWIVFLYFISMLLIAFNLIMTATVTVVKLSDRPDEIRKFVGGTVNLSVGKYVILGQYLQSIFYYILC